MINDRMDVNEWLRKQLEAADPDLLREMVRAFAETLMSADADETCGAPYGTVSPDRVNRRNGYRTRRWDTRVGTIDLQDPEAAGGHVFPRLAPRRQDQGGAGVRGRAWQKPMCGVSRPGGWRAWWRRWGSPRCRSSQVSEIAKDLDEVVDDFRNRPLDRGPYTYVWADALFLKVREGGRVVNVAFCTPWGSTATDTERSSASSYPPPRTAPAGFPSGGSLVARGLAGVQLVDLRRPPRPGRGDPGRPAGSVMAEMQNALHAQPVDQSAQGRLRHGGDHGPHHLRPTRPRQGVGPASAGRRSARRRRLCRRRHPPRRGSCRLVGVHRVSQRALAARCGAIIPRSA